MTEDQVRKIIHEYLRANLAILVETGWHPDDPDSTHVFLSLEKELISSAVLPEGE